MAKRTSPKMREMLEATSNTGFAISRLSAFGGASQWHADGKRFSGTTGQALVKRGWLVPDPDKDKRQIRYAALHGYYGTRYVLTDSAPKVFHTRVSINHDPK